MLDVQTLCAEVNSLIPIVSQMAIDIRANGLAVSFKADHELVTEADSIIESYLREKLSQTHPEISFYGEESGKSGRQGASWRILIDPIDGTMVFAAGMDYFGISIALTGNNQSMAGWLIFPERNITAYAIKDHGAWMGAERLTNAPLIPKPLSECLVVCDYGIKGGTRAEIPAAIDRFFKPIATRVRYVLIQACFTWSAFQVITGKLDGYIHPGVGPYDLAAAILIAKEAGRAVGSIDPGCVIDLTQAVIPVIIARDEETLVLLQAVLRATQAV